MKKTPADFQKYVDALEENFLDTAESLVDVTDEQWKQMGIPVGLVNKIRKRLASSEETANSAPKKVPVPSSQPVAENVAMVNEEEKKEETKQESK